jgi:hypothetical protein
MTIRPHTLKNLRVHEISLVDSPANPGAIALLFKRKEPPMPAFAETHKIEKADDIAAAIAAAAKEADQAAARAHIIARAKALGCEDTCPAVWRSLKSDGAWDRLLTRLGIRKAADTPTTLDPDAYADAAEADLDKALEGLGTAISSILGDAAVTDKAAAITKSLGQFRVHTADKLADHIEKAMRDVALAAGAGGSSQGGKEGLMPTIEELTKEITTLTARVTKAETEANIAKLSQTHADYAAAADMSEDDKATFAAKTPTERDAHMAKNPIKKSDPKLPPEVVEALAKAKETSDRLAVLEADRALIDMRKRAVDIGVGEAHAEVMLKARTGDQASIDKVFDLVKAANAQAKAGALFSEFGSRGGAGAPDGSARAEVQTKAEELRKSDGKLTLEIARVQVRKNNPDLAQRERAEERAAIHAV